jgi:signal transduction histidine kinase
VYFPLYLENGDIIQVIRYTTQSVTDFIKDKGFDLVFETEISEKIMAFDNDKMERIILNLLSNAIKFTNKGGIISVNIYERADKIMISIKDTGIGIPDDKQIMIFERFRQVNETLIRNNEGSGIGLSLVKSLVEMHGGKIYVNSEVGAGSEFVIELPAKQALENKNWKVSNYYNSDRVEKINIEFSDIYMQK